MQIQEIKQRMQHVEQTIQHAYDACQKAGTVPNDLKDSIQQLNQKSGEARSMMQQTQDESRIRQCVDDLEDLGDKAKDACERSGQVDDSVKNAVMQAHQELSQLKHQLH